jgi:hypothetical protein
MFKIIVVIGISLLFFGASVVSSMDNVVKNIPAEFKSVKSVYSSEEKSWYNTTWYEFISGGSDGTGFYAFYSNGTYQFCEWEGDDFFSGGTWTNDGRYLCCMYENGTLYDIDPVTFDAYAIGDGGVSLNGLAYNPITEQLYGASSSDLYRIDMMTGEQIHIGAFDTGTTMIAIAFDMQGILYGWDAKFSGESYLYKITPYSGEATLVGGMGINLCFAQDGCFDHSTDTLYLVAFSGAGFLLECDEDTGDCTWLGSIQGQATAHAISYEIDEESPVSTHSLDPPEPDGENGWYVSDLNVTLTATDGLSGVKEIRYRVEDGPTKTINGSSGTFTITQEYDALLLGIEYWAIDNADNQENSHYFTVDMDQTAPTVDLVYEIIGGNPLQGWEFLLTITTIDETSGMERVEIYVNDELIETIYGPGPTYDWIYRIYNQQGINIKVIGYDIAGNGGYDEIKVKNKDIVIKQSIHPFFLKFYDRYPFFQDLLNILGRNIKWGKEIF